VRPGLSAQVDFADDDHIERLRKIGVEKLGLIDAGLDIILHGGVFEITLRNDMVIYSFTEFAMGAFALVRAIIGKAESCIPAQFRYKVQSSLTNHVVGWVVAKMTIQGQISRS